MFGIDEVGASDKKRWYLAGMWAAAATTTACCCLDHVNNFEIYDRLFGPLAIILLVACIWMLVAGVIWSRNGVRSNVVGLAVLNAFAPIIVGVFLFVFDLGPNVHGSAGLLMLFGLFSVISTISMIIGTYLPKRRQGAWRQ
jgi:hypothetical protein